MATNVLGLEILRSQQNVRHTILLPFVFVVLMALLVFLAVTFPPVMTGACSGPGAYGFVYLPETNTSVCYDANGTPQWSQEGKADGYFWPTFWAHILARTND